jgi:hypothetical protein
MSPAKTKSSRYQPHPMLARERQAMERIRKDTGRSYDDWVSFARAKGPSDVRALSRWLQEDHGHRRMDASWIANAARSSDEADYGDPEPMVDALYSGAHAALRPLHESVVDAFLSLGDDVVVTACKTMVPVYRKHVFAEMRPAEGGVDVQLALGEVAAKGRLARSSNRMPGDRMTHHVLVRAKKDVDAELRRWLAAAYEQGAGKMARSTEFEVPADFAKGLRASKTATSTWGSMTPAMRRDMVQWVTSAKQDDTRSRRLGTCLEKLAAGKKRVY